MNPEDAIAELADAGMLTERQAEAFVLRDVEAVPRSAAAESMGVSVNTLDNTLGTAREKVEKAQKTAEAVESIRHEEIPIECTECEAALGGPFSEDEDGNALCLECAGIDPEDAQI